MSHNATSCNKHVSCNGVVVFFVAVSSFAFVVVSAFFFVVAVFAVCVCIFAFV